MLPLYLVKNNFIHVITTQSFFCRRTADVRSVGYSELFVLSREDVLSALKDHPEAEVCIVFSLAYHS